MKREQQFIDFCNKIDENLLSGKIIFKDKHKNNVQVSVDNSIVLDNHVILIEIDASNQAKLVSGQYTLLNLLKDSPLNKSAELVKDKELIFVVIHYYGTSSSKSKYNPNRSINNFKFIKDNLFKNDGINYNSIHIEDLLNQPIKNKIDLIHKLTNKHLV